MRRIALLLACTAAIAPTSLVATVVSVPFHGTVHATEIDTLSFPDIIVTGIGGGDATHLGRFTMTFDITVDLQTASGPASVALTAADGDSISAAGIGEATDDGGVVKIDETYVITGGTGRFAGVSGEFIVHRKLDPVTGASSGSFDGSLTK